MRLVTALSLSFALPVLFAAVSPVEAAKKKKTDEPEATPEPVQTTEEGGFRKVSLDVNGDGKADVYNYYRAGEGDDNTLIVRKEIDLNFDSKIDVVQIWEKGAMTREEIDADFDGRVDWKDFYDQGERIRAEWDTRFDGNADVWRFYEGGVLVRVEMDTDGNTKVDYWEYYEGGTMQRSGWDLNGDGKIDKWGDR